MRVLHSDEDWRRGALSSYVTTWHQKSEDHGVSNEDLKELYSRHRTYVKA
jgi:hypothetical protein